MGLGRSILLCCCQMFQVFYVDKKHTLDCRKSHQLWMMQMARNLTKQDANYVCESIKKRSSYFEVFLTRAVIAS